jgi:hypothetical protein
VYTRTSTDSVLKPRAPNLVESINRRMNRSTTVLRLRVIRTTDERSIETPFVCILRETVVLVASSIIIVNLDC